MYCEKCGKECSDNNVFCRYCGGELRGDAVSLETENMGIGTQQPITLIMYKRGIILIIVLIAVVVVCVISQYFKNNDGIENKIYGDWYNERLEELYFAEDGTYTLFDEGGTYTVDGERIILIDPLGGSRTFSFVDDGTNSYIYDTDSDWVFYPYDVAYEMYNNNIESAEEQRVSTLDLLRDYFVGTWVGDGSNPLHNYTIEIRDDYTFEIIDDEPYTPQFDRTGLRGTWSFEEDWNDQLYCFKATYPSAESDRTHTSEKKFYLPDYTDGDFSDVKIPIYDNWLIKQESTSSKSMTLEKLLDDRPDIMLEINNVADNAGMSVQVKGNDIIYSYDLSTIDGISEDMIKDEAMVNNLQSSLSEKGDSFIALCKQIEEKTGFTDIQMAINFTYNDDVITTNTFSSNG